MEVSLEATLLIDDDLNNLRSARRQGVRTVACEKDCTERSLASEVLALI